MKKIILIAALITLAGCVRDSESASQKTAPTQAKIIHEPANAVAGMLLVKFDRAVETKLDARMTRSGIADFDAILETVNATRMERLFPANVKAEERTRAAGLHLWYKLYFDKSADLEKVAQELAQIAEVKVIEYNAAVECQEEENRGILFKNASLETGPAKASAKAVNDPYLPIQWHYKNTGSEGDTGKLNIGAKAGADINLEPAWKLTQGDPSLVVAVVDQGVKWSHEDLQANMWVNLAEKNGTSGQDNDENGYKNDIYGYNFADGTSLISWSGEKDTGHGTHVAGIVSAVNNNGIGVCGVAGGSGNNDGVRIMSCQIFSDGLGGSTDITAEAIKYAADNGAVILQCSWGYNAGTITSDASFARQDSAEKEAIDYFIATGGNDVIDGGIVIFSAGNNAKAMAGYPGAYSDYISVAAIAADYTPAYYTNYGKGVNISAPGGDYYNEPAEGKGMILSCSADDTYPYIFMQGTSMACPSVSGIAALGLAYAKKIGKKLTVSEFKAMLLASVRDINPYMIGTKRANSIINLERYAGNMGTGYIDAYMLLMNVESTPCIGVISGKAFAYDLSGLFGKGAGSLTYTEVKISDDARSTLGIEGIPTIENGILHITCTKTGSAAISISAIAGGSTIGGGSSMGGMSIERKVAIISRQNASNNGGWL